MLIKEKPKLLFLSPIMPSISGNGLAMRAGAFLEAFSQDYDVFLLIISNNSAADDILSRELVSFCKDVKQLPRVFFATLLGRICHHPRLIRWLGRFHPYPTEWKTISKTTIRASLNQFKGVAFDRIHVFRLYLYPFAVSLAALNRKRDVRIHLDLDEIESTTRLALAKYATDRAEAWRLRRDARLFKNLERQYLPACNQVYVCSRTDRDTLLTEYGIDNVSVIPNTVRLREVEMCSDAHDPFTFLFVGNLNYFPNRDALGWFADEVLPILRRIAPKAFRVKIVGPGTHRELRRLARIPEYDFNGFIPFIDAAYQDSDVVIVPLRAGGGTRTKILEAFAMGKPVVSTSEGAAGLEVSGGSELLLGNDAHEFAEECCLLMKNKALRAALGSRGSEKVRSAYSQELLTCKLRKIHHAR